MSHHLQGADLHTHTVHSDGLYSPDTLVHAAVERCLAAVALTDHDSVGGVAEAVRAGEDAGVEVVPGVELAAPLNGNEIHIVGLFIDAECPVLQNALARIRKGRNVRTLESVRRLGRLGLHVNYRKLRESAQPGVPGRGHLARALVENGFVPTPRAAFKRYLGNGMPAHVPKLYPPFDEAIRIIHGAGGLAVFAHPLLSDADEWIPRLAEARLDAMEVRHPYHSASIERRYRKLCERYGLLPSAGSDCHGFAPGTLGTCKLSDEDFLRLKEAALAARELHSV